MRISAGLATDFRGDDYDQIRRLAKTLPIPVYMTDQLGCLRFYNEAAARLWGQQPQLGSSGW